MKQTVIFVHGFGVMKDARGMFTEIADKLINNKINCVLVDLNKKDSEGNILLNTFSEQVKILKEIYEQNKNDTVDLICHSQGCIVASLANLPSIGKTIFLAPPTENNNNKTIEYFIKNKLTTININGVSNLARRDGTFTIVPADYWKEKDKINIRSLYDIYTMNNDVYVVKGLLDEVVSNKQLNSIFSNAKILELEANHNFTGDVRHQLVKLCEDLVNK